MNSASPAAARPRIDALPHGGPNLQCPTCRHALPKGQCRWIKPVPEAVRLGKRTCLIHQPKAIVND